jgi:hypothetical protein
LYSRVLAGEVGRASLEGQRQDLGQREHRTDELEFPALRTLDHRSHERPERGVTFDEVDEGSSVQSEPADSGQSSRQRGHGRRSHSWRSRLT